MLGLVVRLVGPVGGGCPRSIVMHYLSHCSVLFHEVDLPSPTLGWVVSNVMHL